MAEWWPTGLLLLKIVASGCRFTAPIHTDHTVLIAWQHLCRSFKTDGEGRWLTDLVMLLQGSKARHRRRWQAVVCGMRAASRQVASRIGIGSL